MSDKEIYQKQVAREILSLIEEICFSKAYLQYRIDYGSRGQIKLIIKLIQEKYNIK